MEKIGEAITILINEAMKAERSSVLNAQQVQGGVAFCPSALEKGVRSERSLKLALAEMYIKGVSTRKVTSILEKLCGLEISSTQVSNGPKLLDEELENGVTNQ